MYTRSIAVLLVAINLIGCATQYQVPENVPTATLTVRTSSPHNNIPVTSYRSNDCSDKPGTRLAFLNSKAAGTTYSPQATMKVAADRPLNFSVYSLVDLTMLRSYETSTGNMGVRARWCTPVVIFSPRPGALYEAEHSVSPDGCAIEVFELNQATKARTKVDSAKVNEACPRNMEN
jgi:hypothetical protein